MFIRYRRPAADRCLALETGTRADNVDSRGCARGGVVGVIYRHSFILLVRLY